MAGLVALADGGWTPGALMPRFACVAHVADRLEALGRPWQEMRRESRYMAIWKIEGEKPRKVTETKLKDEKLLEKQLEDWVEADPSVLGEPLLLIGRQVIVPEIKDRIDLLALDPQGNAVVIELKRGKLSDPVDVQALRYASYISRWQYEDFEVLATSYMQKSGSSEFNFNEVFEEFCSSAGVDEVPDINTDQRLLIVGAEVRDRLGSVALWLLGHSVDIKVVEIGVFREGDALFLEPRTIIPLPINRFSETGKPIKPMGKQPWLDNGLKWHLEKRCSAQTKEMLLALDALVQETFDAKSRWGQKLYLAYRMNNLNWLRVDTFPKLLRMRFLVGPNSFEADDLAKRLGIEVFNEEESLAEKLALPSSVRVMRGETTDRVILRAKKGFSVASEEFLKFMTEAYEAFPRG
jgi:hypothetical protein